MRQWYLSYIGRTPDASVMRRWRVGAALLWPLLLGCQEATRPAPIADPKPTPLEPGSLVDPVPTPVANTNSPCGAATVSLDFVRPNLYFAIDASGSMTDGIPRGEGTNYAIGSVPANRYAALSRALQSLLSRVGHRVNYGATLFPTGEVSCDAGEEIHALGPGDDVSFAVSGEAGPVLRSFMFNVSRRTPQGGTPVAQALSALAQRLSGAGPDTYVFLLTDGGPNCNPRARCGIETCIPNIERVRVSDDFTCNDEVNCCDDGLFGSDNCLDTDGSLTAVQALAEAGVRTFVIGMPGSEAYSSLLDQLALAGGVAQQDSPHYYRVADAETLSATVSALGVTLALGCDIELESAPPDPSLVNLFFDGQIIPSDPVDGWTLSNETTVQVLGAACDLLQTGQVLQADVVAGCPIVLR
jgi:hypothetical protein